MRSAFLAFGVVLAVMLPVHPADADCVAPANVGGATQGYAYRPGAEICIPMSASTCFGCEPGFVHRCTTGGWQPDPGRRCGDGGADAGRAGMGRVRVARPGAGEAGDGAPVWPGSAAEPPTTLAGTVPFRHCRYFDADGTEVSVPDEEAERARGLGLVAWQRCETVYCRLYGEDGRPLHYAVDDQDLVRRDIEAGHVSVRASECRPDPRSPFGSAVAEGR